MIHWLNPTALGGLALLALPIVIHLLRTRQAERIPFPSLRFVVPARTASVRLRTPADWLLLAVRLAIVAAAVAAVAGPVVVTASRVRAWNDRTVRAVIVDTSAAMSIPDGSGKPPLDSAREAAAAEVQPAMSAARIETADVREGLVRAAGWLSQAPPARREIVVVSAFPEGALRENDLEALPGGVGVRFVRVGEQTGARHLEPLRLLAIPGAPEQRIATELSGPETRVRLTRDGADQAGLSFRGADPQSRAVQSLLRTVAAAGAPAPSSEQPLVCVFGPFESGISPAALGPGTPRWILRTLARLQRESELQRLSRTLTGSALRPSDQWTAVAVASGGEPLVQLATQSNQLLMQVGAPPESLLAAVAMRALLMARAGDTARPDQEIVRTSPQSLSAWSRPAAGVEGDAWRRVDRSDGRWFWLAAVLLLALEQRLRRAASHEPAEMRDAA